MIIIKPLKPEIIPKFLFKSYLVRKLFSPIYRFFLRHGLGKYYIGRVADKYIFSYLKCNVTEVFGSKMYLGENDELGLSINQVYEPFMTEVVRKMIKPNNYVIDIGANIGYYTLLFSKLVGEGGKVYAFEPASIPYSILLKNIEINNLKNIVVEKMAVSDKKGTATLYLADNLGHSKIGKPDYNQKVKNNVEVNSISLDEYFYTYKGKIDFIKIDVEGAEYLVWKGMVNLIQQNRNIKIITEFTPNFLEEMGVAPSMFIDFILVHGFTIYDIDERKKKLIRSNPPLILNKYKRKISGNLLCIRDQ